MAGGFSDTMKRLHDFSAFEDCAKVARKKGSDSAPKRGRVGLYALCSAVSPPGIDGRPRDGKMLWQKAERRRARLQPGDVEAEAPPTEISNVRGARQKTHVVEPWDVAAAVRFVLPKELALSFFRDMSCVAALEALLTKGCGDNQDELQRALKDLQAVAEDVQAAEEKRRTEREEMISALQPLTASKDMPSGTLRTTRYDDEVLSAIHDFLLWLGLDAYNTWNKERLPRNDPSVFDINAR